MSIVLDGKALADKIIAEQSERYKGAGKQPRLVIVSVGDDAASKIYVGRKIAAAERCHIESVEVNYPEDTPINEFIDSVNRVSHGADGLIIQLPVPDHLQSVAAAILEVIPTCTDVDGLGLSNKALWDDEFSGVKPCTAQGIMDLLSEYDVNLDGKRVCIINRSDIVGKPLAAMMTAANATVTLCHSHTRDLNQHTRFADIVVSAVGKPNFLTADMINSGAIVIDVGIAKIGRKTVGDCAADVAEKAYMYTPVPGGIGPMTVAELMKNVWDSFEGVCR